MQIFEHINFDFLGKRKIFYGVSITLFLLGLINIIFRGLVFGIDFKGGSEIVLEFNKPISISEIRKDVETLGLGNIELKTFGSERGILFKTELQELPKQMFPVVIKSINDEIQKTYPGLNAKIIDTTATSVTYQFPNADTTNRIVDQLNKAGFDLSEVSAEPTNTQATANIGIASWIKENLREQIKDNPFVVLKEEKVGPKVGKELKEDAVIAIFLSLVVILIYLGFRFKFIFAFGAVLALFHDVLITLGLYSVLYNVIPGLNLEIDLTIVAAFLTLVGYSINDTVIVFDRVREYLKIHKTMPIMEVMNMAINRTMSRTILTGGTTLMTVLVLLIFGGEVLRAFAFTLFFGIVIGTYSSIFVASALVLEYAYKTKQKVQF